MEPWQKDWRENLVPMFTYAGLLRLRKMLREQRDRVTQSIVCDAPNLEQGGDPYISCGCPATIAGVGDKWPVLYSVACDTFDRICKPEHGRGPLNRRGQTFLNWWDAGDKEVVSLELYKEVLYNIHQREQGVTSHVGPA